MTDDQSLESAPWEDDSWTFSILIQSVVYRMYGKYEDDRASQSFALELEGFVNWPDPAIENTSAFISAWTEDNERPEKIRRETKSIGTAVVSKDAARVRRISTSASEPFAGVVVTMPMTGEHFRELHDTFSLVPQLPIGIEFQCLGAKVKDSSHFPYKLLVPTDQDQKLRIIHFQLGFRVCKATP